MKQILNTIITIAFLLTSTQSFANIVGMDTHNFNSTDDGMGFVTVKPSQPLDPGVFSVGYFINYATNSLPFFPLSNVTTAQKFTEPNDKIISHDAHFALGIMKGWDVGMNFPYIINQSIDQSANLGTFATTGLTEIRANTKVRVYKGEESGIALAASLSFPRINNNPFTGKDPGSTINLEAIYDTVLSKNWLWAFNVGYRIRSNGSTITADALGTPLSVIQVPLENQVIYSTALSYWMESWKTNWIFELYGSSPVKEVQTFTDRKISNLEALVGGKWQPFGKDFDLHGGLGTGVYRGLATPDIRAYVGFNWRFGLWGVDSSGDEADDDHDGVWNSRDKCPDSPPGAIVDRDGCSEADDDHDGVANRLDECPNTPAGDTVDEKGCSIVNKLAAPAPVDGDDDGDGIVNSMDECPGTPPNTQVNKLGCPPERVESIILADLKFISGKAQLTPASDKKLKANIEKLYPIRSKIQKVIVEGHTDSVGRDAYNLELSRKRANTVKQKLIKYLKINGAKVHAKGYGEEQPVADNKTALGKAKNRRVEIQVIKEDVVFKAGEKIKVD